MKRKILFTALAAVTLALASASAEAHPRFGIAIGLPGFVIGGPAFYPGPVYGPGPYYGGPAYGAFYGYPGWNRGFDGWHGREFHHGFAPRQSFQPRGPQHFNR
jgi:hypothetical protein